MTFKGVSANLEYEHKQMKIFLIVSFTIIGFLFLQNIIVPLLPNNLFGITKVFAETSMNNNKLYWITGDLTLNHEINPIGVTGVIFVDGNLFINKKQTTNSKTTGLVFIVRGKIYINPEVERVDAFMISYGGFCSAYQEPDPYTCQDVADSNQQKQLIINGSVISLNPTIAPQFVRQKTTLTTAAETINYQPKYLVILKDIFSRDLKIWQEVQ